MRIIIKTTNLALTQNLDDYIHEKIGKLERFCRKYEFSEARVEVGRTTRHHQEGDIFRAEVNLRLPGKVLRAEAERQDIYFAIDEAKEELERQLREHRGKLWAKFRRSARVFKDLFRFGRFFKK